MTGEFHLRTPDPSEAPELAALGRETFVETFGHLYRPADLQTFLEQSYSETKIAQEFADPEVARQVITFQDRLIGFIKLGPVHVPATNPPPQAREIWQLYIRQEHLGQGLGDLLMAWALDYFDTLGTSDLFVSVFSENPRAIRFYQKYGFEKCGQYDYPVGEQIDLEWIMRLNPSHLG